MGFNPVLVAVTKFQICCLNTLLGLLAEVMNGSSLSVLIFLIVSAGSILNPRIQWLSSKGVISAHGDHWAFLALCPKVWFANWRESMQPLRFLMLRTL